MLRVTQKGRQTRDQLEREKLALEADMAKKREFRQRRISAARKTLEEQERMQNRREEREKRRREIALEVAGDLGEEEEQRLKKMYANAKL